MGAAKRLQTIHVTKKVQTEAEYVETKARFLAVIAGAGEWATIHRELGDLKVRRVYRVAARQAPHAAGPRQHGEGHL
jgi:hypothetical protein